MKPLEHGFDTSFGILDINHIEGKTNFESSKRFIDSVDLLKFNYNKIYYKVTNQQENHNGLQYHNGLIRDVLPFNNDKTASCVPGGIYFTDLQHIFQFLSYGVWIRPIKIKKGTKVLLDPEGDKFRAESVHMCRRIPKKIFIKKMMPKKLKGYLNLSGCDLKGITLPQSVGGYLDLSGCDLKGITLPQSVGGYLNLSGCDLKGITLPQSVGGYLYLSGCDLKGIDKKILKKYSIVK